MPITEVPMDPLMSIVTALAAGAAAALQSTVEQVVKDGYAALKSLIQRKYTQVNIDLLEQDPASEGRRVVVKEDLAKTTAGTDGELLHAAEALLEAIERHNPTTARTIGVDIEDIKAAALTIKNIRAGGLATGVRARNLDVDGKVDIEGVQAEDHGGIRPNV
jgi:hypothetical protein